MNKLYKNMIKSVALLACGFMANVAYGQTLVVTCNGAPVENNAVIDLPYVVEDLSMPDFGLVWFSYKWDPHLEASITDGIEEMTVTVTNTDNTDGFQLCWPMGCQAVPPGGSSTATGTVNDEPTDLQIHKAFEFMDDVSRPTEGGIIKVNIECESAAMELTINCVLKESNAVIGIEADAKADYFTLQGVRVSDPQKGQLYIERKGGKTAKRIF